MPVTVPSTIFAADQPPAPDAEPELSVRVLSKTLAAEGVVALRLQREGGGPLPRFAPGAHVELLVDGVEPRQYSLCGDTNDHETWRLGILRERHGRGSSVHIHDHLREGDLVRVRGPRNHFPMHPSPRYLFIAGGIGITPLVPMIAAAERQGAEWRLQYGGRSLRSMAFLAELARYGERVQLSPQDEVGLVDLQAELAEPVPDTLIYCCGPEALLAAVESHVDAWPAGSLHVERFRAAPSAEPVRASPFDVVLEASNLRVTVSPDVSILEAVQAAGVGVLSSCTEGVCGTCETKVLAGVPDHRDSILTDEEQHAGDCMMICVSRSLSPELRLDL
jgi:ferredoxin-NADP reductase